MLILTRLHETEGPEIKEKIQDEVRQWFISHKEQTGKFPIYPTVSEGGSAKIPQLKAQTMDNLQQQNPEGATGESPKPLSASPSKQLLKGVTSNAGSRAGSSRLPLRKTLSSSLANASVPGTPNPFSPSRTGSAATGTRTGTALTTKKSSTSVGPPKRPLKVSNASVVVNTHTYIFFRPEKKKNRV